MRLTKNLLAVLAFAISAFASLPASAAYRDLSGTIASGTVSQQLDGSATQRRKVFIANPSTATESLWINTSQAAAVSGTTSIEVVAGGSVLLDTDEAIYITATTAGHKFLAKTDGTVVGFSAPGAGGGGGGGGASTIADGADVNAGATTDAACAAGGAGTVSCKLRLMTTQLGTLHTDITAANTQLPSALGAQAAGSSLSVVPATSSTFAISAASLPLPSGAATAANQVPGSSTASADATRLPVSSPDSKCTTGTATANGVMTGSPYSFPLDTTGYESITVHITSAGSGSINYEQSNDDSTFLATVGTASSSIGGGAAVAVTAVTGLYKFPVAGQYFQQRVSSYASGTITTVTCLRKSGMQATVGANIPNTLVANINQLPGWTAAHMTAATTTTHKSGSGVVHNICVNTAGAGSTATVYDNTAGSGTVIAVIDTSTPRCVLYDATFSTGLTITTTATAPDITVTYR